MGLQNIAVIGAGELGSRHLQSLAKCQFDLKIQVVDPSAAALDRAQKRFLEIPTNAHIQGVKYCQAISELDRDVDIAIVATSSDIRLTVIKELTTWARLRFLILEKVLFPSLEELDEAEYVLGKLSVPTYVNCPKRGFQASGLIREKLKGEAAIRMFVEGENWGLGCNAIHFIDLLSSLQHDTSYELETNRLNRKIENSKRTGFIEFTGELGAHFSRGAELKLVSRPGAGVSFQTRIESENFLVDWDERSGALSIFDKTLARSEGFTFRSPFQSELTHRIVTQILAQESVDLPSFALSAKLHRPLLNGLLSFYNELENTHVNRLMIT